MALIDEIYDNCNLDDLFERTTQPAFASQYFYAVINGSELNVSRNSELDQGSCIFDVPSSFPEESMSSFSKFDRKRVYMRKLYRNPLQISKLCTKLRRQLDYNSDMSGDISSVPWAMSIDNGLEVHSKTQSIRFVSHQKFNFKNEGNLDGKNIAIIKIEIGENFIDQFPNVPVHLFQIDKLENADAAELEFTGVEFDTVYISFGIIGDDLNRSKKVELILYNAVSRSTDFVIVLFHEKDWELFEQLKNYGRMDVVLDNLNNCKRLSEIELEKIDSRLRLLQAIKAVIVIKDLPQFRTLLPLIAKFNDATFYQSIQNLLASCFTWCKKGNILEMLRLFRSETKIDMSEENGWKCLSQSLLFIAADWKQTLRQEFFTKFLEVSRLSFKNFKFAT